MEKAIALLSGGIDSPVAINLMKERVKIIAVHFHQMPLSSQEELEKVKKLSEKLELEKIYLVPFVNVFKELAEKCQHRYYFVLSKIAMLKAAEEIARQEEAHYLITGENLAQVSSQTLSNLRSITSQVKLEVFRPLLTYNKQEIIDLAVKMGTYDLSKGPEICHLLGPKSPATRSNSQEIGKELEKIDLKKIIKESLNKAEIITA